MKDPVDLTDGGGRTFGIEMTEGSGGLEPVDESDFELATGRFRGDDGEFAIGSPPPDYSAEANRFHATDGEFKTRSTDLFDEQAERRFDNLSFKG